MTASHLDSRSTPLPLRAISLVLLGFTSACGEAQEEREPLLRPVRFVAVQGNSGGRVHTFSGVAQASEESRLSFRVAGTVQEVPVKVGDQVEADDLIAKIDPTDFQLQVSEAQAAVGQAQAQHRNANAEYARVRALYENNNSSRQELDSARTAAETAAMAVRSATQRTQLARRQIEYCRLTAPTAGSVSAVDIDTGENVNPGQVVAVVQGGQELEVRVSVPGSIISRVEDGMSVQIKFSELESENELAGKVSEVGVSAGGGTTYPVTVQLSRAHEALRPGMAADVTFSFEEEQTGGQTTRFRVPSFAVSADDESAYVWIVKRQQSGIGVVQRRAIESGDLDSTGVVVSKGLKEGDLVVTAGMSRMREGLKVRLPADRATDRSSGSDE